MHFMHVYRIYPSTTMEVSRSYISMFGPSSGSGSRRMRIFHASSPRLLVVQTTTTVQSSTKKLSLPKRSRIT